MGIFFVSTPVLMQVSGLMESGEVGGTFGGPTLMRTMLGATATSCVAQSGTQMKMYDLRHLIFASTESFRCAKLQLHGRCLMYHREKSVLFLRQKNQKGKPPKSLRFPKTYFT